MGLGSRQFPKLDSQMWVSRRRSRWSETGKGTRRRMTRRRRTRMGVGQQKEEQMVRDAERDK